MIIDLEAVTHTFRCIAYDSQTPPPAIQLAAGLEAQAGVRVAMLDLRLQLKSLLTRLLCIRWSEETDQADRQAPRGKHQKYLTRQVC